MNEKKIQSPPLLYSEQLSSSSTTKKSQWLNTRSFLAHAKLLMEPATLQDCCPPHTGLSLQAAVKLCLLHCAHCRDGVNEQFCAGQLPLPIQKPSSSYSVTRVWSVWSCPLILIPFEHWGGPQKQKLSEFWVLFLHSHTVGSCWPGCISLLRTRPFLSVSVSLHSDICPLLFPNPGNATLLLLDQTVPQFLAVFLKPSPPPLKTFM